MNIVKSSVQEFQSNRLDSYFLRVVQASQSIDIRLTSDLTDDSGKILFSQSSPLNEFTARRFFNSTIQQDLATAFTSDKILHWVDIQKDLITQLEDDEFLSRTNHLIDLKQILEPVISCIASPDQNQCIEGSIESSPDLHHFPTPRSVVCTDTDFRFRLTILKITCPETYTRTLLCTWLCVLLVKEMRLPQSDLRAIFIASLAHDLGMLHISNEILGSDDTISAQEWLELQRHVPASASLVRKSFSESDEIALAIEEHHERCDGTGYPHGKVESELSQIGKILGLSDSVIAIFRNRFDSKLHSWRDVIPVIQMNAQAYFFRHAEILGNLWRRAEVPTNKVINVDEVHAFVEQLQFKHGRTLAWFNCLTKRMFALGFTHGDRKLHAMQNVALHLATSAKGVGIFSPEFMDWVKQLSATDFQEHSKSIQDAYVKLQEIIANLQKLTRMLKIYIDEQQSKDKEIEGEMKLLLDEIKAILIGELI